MLITEITASFGRTIQFQQFEPVNVHVSLKAEIVDGENSLEKLNKMAQDIVNKEIDNLIEQRKILDEARFADEVPGIITKIERCSTVEEKIALWEELDVSIRRVPSIKAAFKK